MKTKKKLTFFPLAYRDWSVIYCEICRKQLIDEFYKVWHWKFSDTIYLWDGKKIAVIRAMEEQTHGMVTNVIKRIEKDADFMLKLAVEVLEETKKIKKHFKKVIEKDFDKMTGADLCREFEQHIKISSKMTAKMLITQHFPIYLKDKNLQEKYKKELELCIEVRAKWDKIAAPYSDFTCVKFGEEALRRASLNQLYGKFISIDETKEIFLGKISITSIKKLENILKERSKYFLLAGGYFQEVSLQEYLTKNGWYFYNEEINEKATKIKGVSTLIVDKIIQGEVSLVHNKTEISKIKNGDIVVCPAIIPEYSPMYGKISGIITDEGGITSHAAIISRELKIPAIIATKVATKLLKDGDLVALDTKKGIVQIIK
ncbi:MAG: PEP-utilizing enzyme [Candidatus Moraniibacteriota bacterium]